MPNSIKYNTSAETLALKSGNFWIGTGDVGKGPTNVTGYYNGITPPSGGYTIYLNKASGGPSIYVAANDSELIYLSNTIAGQTFATAAEALGWFATQTDKMIFNIDYPSIITNGLTTCLDVTNVLSYPNTGNLWYDLSGNDNNGSLAIGSPTYTTFEGKRTIRFSNQNKNVYAPPYDGFILSNNPGISSTSTSFTFESWFYQITADNGQIVILSNAGSCDGYRWGPNGSNTYWLFGDSTCTQFNEGTVSNSSTLLGRWVQMVGIFDRANTLGGGLKFYNYVNGVLQSSVGIFNPVISTSTPGMIACCGAFDGYISIVRVYNRALLPSEITQNFNAQKSYFGL
jgi:Concanavalin A-like lectin/glucanases superfamily